MAAGSASKTIGSIFMNAAADEEIGIRVTSGNLAYTNGQGTSWFGSGIMDKPIGDFHPTEWRAVLSRGEHIRNVLGTPYFANVRIDIHTTRIIPEPAEYTLVVGLFALAFVILKNAYERRNGRNLANPNPKTSPSLSEHRLNN